MKRSPGETLLPSPVFCLLCQRQHGLIEERARICHFHAVGFTVHADGNAALGALMHTEGGLELHLVTEIILLNQMLERFNDIVRAVKMT